MSEETCYGWAIDTREPEPDPCGFLGRYSGEPGMIIPPTLGGYRTAVYNSRDEARAALRRIKEGYNPWPNARVVKVQVTVREVKP